MSGRERGQNKADVCFILSSVSGTIKKHVLCPTRARKKDIIVMFFAGFSGFLSSRDGSKFS